MKKLLLALLVAPLLLGACNNYDDDPLREWVGDLEDRIEQLEELCAQMNTNIASLQTIVSSIQNGKTIASVNSFTEGDKSGYRITFSDGQTINLYNGTDGADGEDGNKGETGDKGDKGEDGKTPLIGVAQDNGTYYWTLDGEWLTDASGNRIKAEGKDGKDGADGSGEGGAGKDGKDGITPQLKIEEDYWWVSTDEGATWQRLGKATGADGDSFFRSVEQDDAKVTLTLADGTVIELPKAPRLRIELASTNCALTANTPAEVPYTITGANGEVRIEVVGSGDVKAKAVASSATEGIISILTANPDAIDEYTKVLVFAADDSRTAMAALTFEKGVIVVTESYEVDAAPQQLTVPVETNLDYEVAIETAAQGWISQVKTRATRIDNLAFDIAANSGAARSASIVFTAGSEKRTVVVAQAAGGEEPGPIDPPVEGVVELDRLYGYAEGTTGGDNATAANTHHFNDGDKFREWLYLREKNKVTTPAKVYLSGTFTKDNGRDGNDSSPWFDIKRTGNISIYGLDDFRMQNIGFFINESSNIILRNVYIVQPKASNDADGISMQESNNIWVDHCTFESVNQNKDYEDGSCDITHQTYNVTVSWCHFIKTQKSCLVGHSNSATADTQITATFHHNFFDLSSSRHPRVRFGRAHVYNNFFNQVTTYGVGSAYGAMVLVEDNLFDGVRLPTDICTFPAKPSGSNWVSNLTGSVAGYLYERGNTYLNKPANATEPYPLVNVQYKAYNGEALPTPYTYDDFKPAYNYVVDAAEGLATIVPAGAGVGKLPGYASAPIEVDNGGITTTDPDPGTDPDPDPQPGGTEMGNGWTAFPYGGNAAAMQATAAETLTLTAQGKFESGQQNFGFVYREVTGDFVATVTVESYETPGTSNQSLAGLMLTPDFSAAGNDFLHVMAAAGPSSAYYRSVRTSVKNAARGALTAPAATVEGAKAILKLERAGDECSISYSLDNGATFGKARTETFEGGLPETVYLGVAVNSGNNSKTATAVFSNMTLNGAAVAFSAQ